MGKYKIGDKIKLKADNSPNMVVVDYGRKSIPGGRRIPDETLLVCSWFDAAGKPNSHEYPEDSLESI